MSDFQFEHIAPRLGGKRESFEEMCCQIARKVRPHGTSFTRLQGAGGDGGIECYAELTTGKRIGWQAKYVFDINQLISQLDTSLAAALRIHPMLSKYIVCFPFDLTGPTGRRGKSSSEKFETWRSAKCRDASVGGKSLEIEAWPASRLRAELIGVDPGGGIRAYFFDATVLSPEWFQQHIRNAFEIAGPRYTPDLTVETKLWSWFEAFGQTPSWLTTLSDYVGEAKSASRALSAQLSGRDDEMRNPRWPAATQSAAKECAAHLAIIVDNAPCRPIDGTSISRWFAEIEQASADLAHVEAVLGRDLDSQHGGRRWDTPGFRQFMAEYECAFPTANIDAVRKSRTSLQRIIQWLRSPEGQLGFRAAFVLTGAVGSGKTHGVCDAARKRLSAGRLSCVMFGHQFRGEPDVWTRLQETLALPLSLGRDGLLDALNSAAQASGHYLIICIDAVNETRPLQYWRERIALVTTAVALRSHLRLCFTCRTSFACHCLPVDCELPIAEHQGFRGIEGKATRQFFSYYGLEPSVTPILQPELSNPLYLRLACRTMQARQITIMPTGWTGITPVVRAFMDEMERSFAHEHETETGNAIVSRSLLALAREIAASGESGITWSEASRIVAIACPNAAHLRVLEWLIRADLLIEDAPRQSLPLGDETTIRPSFERLGDLLIASELLSSIKGNVLNEFKPGGRLAKLTESPDNIARHNGVLSAISILLPEESKLRIELVDLLPHGSVRLAVLRLTLESLAWRTAASFTAATTALLREALHSPELSRIAMNAALALTCFPSPIDAMWIHEVLCERPMAQRDAYWCRYLHAAYDSGTTVPRLIEAAFDLPLDQISPEVAERWVIALAWFTAASDRRVKDNASRALIAVMAAHPVVVCASVRRLFLIDDDAVRERTLLCAYGALILSRNTPAIRDVCAWLAERVELPELINNAMIRDHACCLADLASALSLDPTNRNVQLFRSKRNTAWPLTFPSDEELSLWEGLPRLAYSCLDDDFFRYSMGCLNRWEHKVSRIHMGKWILRQVASVMQYAGSGCEQYDEYMLSKFGGGSGRPMWAERIGKKYQWIAMFRLAARLSDHVEPERDSWSPARTGPQLIFVGERQFDPTLPANITGRESEAQAWWTRANADLQKHSSRPDIDWVVSSDDIPSIEQLIAPIRDSRQEWRTLETHRNWGNRPNQAPLDERHRHVWLQLRSYLVTADTASQAYSALRRRNFFGRWMPEGATWSSGYAGEYPWACAFKMTPDEYHTRGGHSEELRHDYISASNHLAVEWEDASLAGRFHMCVPARVFFSAEDLWWDGHDGYRNVNDRTVFRDPSVTQAGSSALLADAEELSLRLEKLGLSVIWTLLGEKMVRGNGFENCRPRRIFCQIARLRTNGSTQASKITFFEHEEERDASR